MGKFEEEKKPIFSVLFLKGLLYVYSLLVAHGTLCSQVRPITLWAPGPLEEQQRLKSLSASLLLLPISLLAATDTPEIQTDLNG